jgi:hypothetical protein
MVNGRLFKIDVEEAHCKLHSSFTSGLSFFSLFLHWGWSLVRSFMHGMGYGERVSFKAHFSKTLFSFCFFFF